MAHPTGPARPFHIPGIAAPTKTRRHHSRPRPPGTRFQQALRHNIAAGYLPHPEAVSP